MGFFDSLRKFFGNDKVSSENEIVEGESKEIGDIKELKEELDRVEELLNSRREFVMAEVFGYLTKIEDDIVVLKEIDLNKERTNDRIREITEIGRKDYISDIYKLIKSLRKGGELGYVETEVDKFFNYSIKSHFKATQLIGKEIGNIVNSINKIKNTEMVFIKENLDLVERRDRLRKLTDKYEIIEKKEREKKVISGEVLEIKGFIENDKCKLEEIKLKIEKAKESPEYFRMEKLSKEGLEKKENLKRVEFEIRNLLDRKILAKYIHLVSDADKKKFVKKYIEDPVYMLLSDDENVIDLVRCVRGKVQNGEITVKGVDSILRKLKEDVFIEYKENIGVLKSEIEKVEECIKETGINLDDLINDKIKVEEVIFDREERVKALEKKIGNIETEVLGLKSG